MSIYLTKDMVASAAHQNPSSRDQGLFYRLFLAAKQQWQRRRMIAALQALDDRMLADIGLHRGDIPQFVAGFSSRELRMAPVTQAARATDVMNDAYLRAA